MSKTQRASTPRLRLSTVAALPVTLLLVCAAPDLAHAQAVLEGGALIIHHPTVMPPAAQPTIPPDEELRAVELSESFLALVERLDSVDFEERESAMREMIDTLSDPTPVYALLTSSPGSLSPEQRHRLMAVLHERILNAHGGALGISMQVWEHEPGDAFEVEVSDLVPGLPAAEVLAIGDVIIAIDGETFHSRHDLTTRVSARRPGDVVTLTVLRPNRPRNGPLIAPLERRNAQRLEIEITLGSSRLLRDPVTGATQVNPAVAEQRRRQWAEVEHRFRRQPLVIELEGDWRDLAPHRSARTQRDLDPAVEEHSAIRFLKRYRELVQAGTVRPDPDLVQEQLDWLRMQLRRPGITQENRELLERVIERYIELTLE